MSYAVALTSELHAEAARYLVRQDGQEDVVFAVWHPSRGATRFTALVSGLLLPVQNDRHVHGNASFEAQYIERAIGEAAATGAGLALLHSHPAGSGWQGMSRDDVSAEESNAAAVFGGTGYPLLGMTLAGDLTWSARFWPRIGRRQYERRWCATVKVVGRELLIMRASAPTKIRQSRLDRTISAWGPGIQELVQELHVGVVGAGSVGCLVAESLARSGVRRITLLDFDSVEEVNLDRLLHATLADVRARRPKVQSLARGLKRSATARDFDVQPLEWSIVEPKGFAAALDCDLLFSCVDRPWPRQVLNLIAYAHLIPCVDGGVRLEPRRTSHGLKRGDVRAHTATPGRACLECLGQYDPADVGLERMGQLDDPTYIASLPASHRLRMRQNVFAFSMLAGSLEVLQMLSMIVAPGGVAEPGAQTYHFIPGSLDADFSACKPDCPYQAIVSFGDDCGIAVTGAHPAAKAARDRRA